MEDNLQFSNMDSWKSAGSGKYGLTFKQIVLMHINKCVYNGSVEWRGGYTNKQYRPIGGGQTVLEETYIPSTREVYCNSVRILRACLLGYFDKKMKEADKKITEKLNKELKKYKELLKESDKMDDKKIDYHQEKINNYLEWFEELILLGKRLNFFEEESSEEEM